MCLFLWSQGVISCGSVKDGWVQMSLDQESLGQSCSSPGTDASFLWSHSELEGRS